MIKICVPYADSVSRYVLGIIIVVDDFAIEAEENALSADIAWQYVGKTQ